MRTDPLEQFAPVRGRAARLERRRAAVRRFYVLTGASTVVPGLGLIPTRYRRLGILITSGFVLVLLGALYKALSGGVLKTALSVGLSRRALLLTLAFIVFAAMVWVGAILLTASATRPHWVQGAEGFLTRAFALLACLVILVPSWEAVRYVSIQRSLIGSIFEGLRPSGAAGPVEGENPWAGVPRVNVLLLGSDAGTDREGTRTDSMMVASINTKTGDTVLFGVPRNLENVPFPESDPLHEIWPHGFGPCPDPTNGAEQCLMNAVWTEAATNHPDLFPGDKNPGLTATRDAIGEVLGLKIDYTTIIDLRGFSALVNAMGGVDVNVTERVCIGCHVSNGQIVGTTGYIEKGEQHLDGYHALWYARSRAQSDDFGRMRRQRCVVGALVSQVNPVEMLKRYPRLAKVAKDNISIDIPQNDLGAWVSLIDAVKKGKIRSLPLTNKVINVANPDYDKIHELVQNAISAHPTVQPKPSATATGKSTRGSGSATSGSGSGSGSNGSTGTQTTEEGLTNLSDSC